MMWETVSAYETYGLLVQGCKEDEDASGATK